MKQDYLACLNSFCWPIARFRFEFRTEKSIRLSSYAGSMLRGVFGHSLRKTCCMTKKKECTGCPLQTTCPYSRIFEPRATKQTISHSSPSVPVPYVFEPSGWGERILCPGEELAFDMVFFGEAIKMLPLVIFTLQKGLSHDIGHGSAVLKNVYQMEGNSKKLIYQAGSSEIEDYQGTLKLTGEVLESCSIEILTPLRLQKNGKIQGASAITSVDFFNTIARRVGLFNEYYFSNEIQLPYQQIISEAAEVFMVKDLYVRSWTRYSNRQKALMNLSGLVGTIEFKNLSPGLSKLLELAQYFHMGKNASFGLGKIEIQ